MRRTPRQPAEHDLTVVLVRAGRVEGLAGLFCTGEPGGCWDMPPRATPAEARASQLGWQARAFLSAWSAAEPDLVPVGIVIRNLAHTVGVGLPLRGLDPPIGDLVNECIEVVDEDGVHGVTGVFGPPHDEHRPMLVKVPYGLCVVRNERRRGAEQLFVPGQRRRVVVNWDSRVQVNGHDS